EQVIKIVAKGIEKVLRKAKENRRLICNELLVPQTLTAHIASDVIEISESEPCGIRGCLLMLCIEDSQPKHKSAHSQHGNSQRAAAPSCRLLGEFAIDHSVVPTFEVIVTLKRGSTNWYETVENKLLGKEKIILSEVYLLSKRK